MGERSHHIDWLRTCASYLVVIYHTAQFFDYQEKTYIKDGELSWTMDIFTRFVHLWHMPLFFLLAGWSSSSSLRRRGPCRFLWERAQKLVFPLLFGLFAWCAPPRWVELKNGLFKTATGQRLPAQPTISFANFLQEYYYSSEGISWGHLWFLAYLFTFTALYLPGFWALSKLEIPAEWLQAWAGWVLANAPIIPLVAIEVTMRERWPGFQNLTDDWANFWFYSTFFVAGFCLAQYPILEEHLNSSWRVSFAIGGLSSIFCLLPSLSAGYYNHSGPFFKHACRAFSAWYTVQGLLAYYRRKLSGRPPPSFWTTRAFPVYVLHDVPLCLLANSLLPGSWGPSHLQTEVKFIFLSTSALVLTFLIIPRHVAFLTTLVGMKDRTRGGINASSSKKMVD